MVQKLDTEMVEAVYAIIYQRKAVLKRDLSKSIDGLNDELLNDILFYLKLRRGILIKRGRGIFKDYKTYLKMSSR